MHNLVRAYFPQAFPGNIQSNTDYPPQSFSSETTPPVFNLEIIEETPGNFTTLNFEEVALNFGIVEIEE